MKTQKSNFNQKRFPDYLQITNCATLANKKNLWHNTLEKHIKYKHLAYFLAFEIWKISKTVTRNKTNAHAMAWAVLICNCGFSRTSKADN